MSAPGIAARRAAADLLSGVVDRHESLADQLAASNRKREDLDPAERARAQSLATRTLRHLDRIDALLGQFLDRAPPKPARNALRLAVAEVHLDGIPPHAAVDGAVRLAKSHQKSRHLSGLVNAVARRAANATAEWHSAETVPTQDWLSARIEAIYGTDPAVAIQAVHRTEPPLDLTPRRPAEAEDIAAELGGQLLPTGSIRLENPGRVTELAGFEEGKWWVQDAAAALPARLLGKVRGEKLLDLCAAPGGKTLQLAAAGGQVTALDVSSRRLKRLRENLARTKLPARIVTADALSWGPDATFDAILLDAPCSATGTLRRHPDLPHIRKPEDVASLVTLQRDLLTRAWDWLAPGGRLIYCTCSLLPEEGEAQISAFLESQPSARLGVVETDALGIAPDWLDAAGSLRLRPDFWAERGGMDGFYAAVLHKM
ncbi:RsmB/NOP family class I SAM-dependent RNA methyltransferase [Amaricoccus macauensis]|uniref:RsmB/NOP family class I SAM-dependent RNA methyltransferase n=1 Tax=Amaricoccus macauensis TaxID=57001 RepID=UPI003C79B2F1